MSTGLPFRKDVPQEEKWDLKDLFKDDQQFYEVLEKRLMMLKN